MFTDDEHGEYAVTVEPFAEKHYIKNFKRKYKGAWDVTWAGLEKEFSNFDLLFKDGTATRISEKDGIQICKTEFRIAQTKQSRHKSGNRCIVAVHTDTREVYILLVYNKTDLSGSSNETAQMEKND